MPYRGKTAKIKNNKVTYKHYNHFDTSYYHHTFLVSLFPIDHR